MHDGEYSPTPTGRKGGKEAKTIAANPSKKDQLKNTEGQFGLGHSSHTKTVPNKEQGLHFQDNEQQTTACPKPSNIPSQGAINNTTSKHHLSLPPSLSHTRTLTHRSNRPVTTATDR